jgi:hypothetical protein
MSVASPRERDDFGGTVHRFWRCGKPGRQVGLGEVFSPFTSLSHA